MSLSLSLPVSLHDYMAACVAAYYQGEGSKFGRAGDFTTAPEISQMFGEMLGGWLAYQARQQNLPADIPLVECGPGRGSLLLDVLRVFQSLTPPILPAALHLLETSESLRQIQKTRLAANTDITVPIRWHASVDSLPDAPMLLLANEFFDCFPIHQYRYCADDGGWQLRHVVAGTEGDSGLAFAWREFTPPPDWPQDKSSQEIHEFAPAHADLIRAIAGPIAKHGGAGLIVDYGRAGYLGDSLQAISQHQPSHPLAKGGAADITAWVNFTHLADVARAAGAWVLPLQSQADFLQAMGIQQRGEVLAKAKSPALRRRLASEIDRLTNPAHMGQAFKVMAILPSRETKGGD